MVNNYLMVYMLFIKFVLFVKNPQSYLCSFYSLWFL